MGGKDPKRTRSRIPRWARLCAVFGALLMVLSGGLLVATQVLVARYAGAVKTEDLFGDAAAANGSSVQRKSDLKGPLNVLLVGIDPREEDTPPLSDSIMIVHIPEGLQSAFVFSIPRDTLVEIPTFPKSGFRGGKMKINAAMSEGSLSPKGGKPDAARGFELLSKTLTELTGIQRFDAGAIINFDGFKQVVDAMGGVDMYIDERTRSEHLKPDGSRRTYNPRRNGQEHPYEGPQATYEVGNAHLSGWQALDFVRQRYGLDGTDYARQRHQQQFLKAMAKKATSSDVITSPGKLDAVLRAAGNSLTFNGRGYTVVDYAFALKGIKSDAITTIKISGGGVNTGGAYRGEALAPGTEDFFKAVVNDKVEAFLLNRPDFINHAK